MIWARRWIHLILPILSILSILPIFLISVLTSACRGVVPIRIYPIAGCVYWVDGTKRQTVYEPGPPQMERLIRGCVPITISAGAAGGVGEIHP